MGLDHMRTLSFAVSSVVLGCTAGPRESASESKSEVEPEPERVSEPERASEPEPAQLEPSLTRVGREFRPLYRGCARSYGIHELGGEVVVSYASGGVGRFDRMGSRGEVLGTLDFDPGLRSRGVYADRFDLPLPRGYRAKPQRRERLDQRWPEQAMGGLLDVVGDSADDFVISAEFHVYNQTWSSRVARYHGGTWSPSVELPPSLFEWSGRVIAFGDDGHMGQVGPELAWATGEGTTPDFADLLPLVEELRGEDMDESQALGFRVLDLDVVPDGPMVALVTYQPYWGDDGPSYGTWLVIWTAPEAKPSVERLTPVLLGDGDARLAVVGERVFVQLETLGSPFEWRAGEHIPIPGFEADEVVGICDPSGERPWFFGADAGGRPWIRQGSCVGLLDGDAREVFALPADSAKVAGSIELGLWRIDEAGTIWSRAEDGAWESHAVVGLRELGEDAAVLGRFVRVTGRDEAWLELIYEDQDSHEWMVDPLSRMWMSSDLFTTRPVERPNDCR